MASPSISAALASLDLAKEDDVPALSWLEASATAPDEWWAALSSHADAALGKLKSKRGVAYDLYADAVLRHRTTERVALWSRDAQGRWTGLTYRELDRRACACAAAWLARGVKPGDVIALVMTVGPAFLTALMGAFRMGAVVAVVDPDGTLARERALAALAPAHVVTDPDVPTSLPAAWTKKLAPLALTAGAPATPPPAYGAKQVAALLLSPLHAPLDKPRPLTAQRAFEGALRDAILTLRLSPGSTLTAPGVDLTQYQPALLLSCCLAGATYVDVPWPSCVREPRAVVERPAQTWVVTHRARDLLLQARPRAAELPTHWLRPIEEPFDWAAWRAFVGDLGLTKVPVSQVLMDASDGGAVLTSTRRPGSANMRVLPPAGEAWALADVAAPARPAADAGVYAPMEGKKPRWPGWFILARTGAEYLFGGPVEARRAGQLYPRALVEAAAGEVTGLCGAAVASLPQANLSAQFTLCAFTGGAPGAPEPAALRAHLAARAGERALPDAIEVLPLFPRRAGPRVDADWVQRQHSLGWLRAKAASPNYRRLTELRRALGGS